MTFDLSIIFDIPECQYFAALRCHVAFAFKIRNHRALRCKQRCVASKANVAFAFKIRNHRALRCFLYLSVFLLFFVCVFFLLWIIDNGYNLNII